MKLGPYNLDRVHLADALQGMLQIPDGTVDVIFTDPPYSSGARNSAMLRSRGAMRRSEGPHGRWFGGDNLTSHGFAMLVRSFGVEAFRITKEGGHLFIFIDWRQWPVLHGAIESSGWTVRACLIWDKVHFGMGNGFRQQAEFILHASKGVADNFKRHDLGTVFRHARHKEDLHPTQKPEVLITNILSAVPGEVILDPFAGSGSALLAAESWGRRRFGFDINPEFVALANERLEAYRSSVPRAERKAGQRALFENPAEEEGTR